MNGTPALSAFPLRIPEYLVRVHRSMMFPANDIPRDNQVSVRWPAFLISRLWFFGTWHVRRAYTRVRRFRSQSFVRAHNNAARFSSRGQGRAEGFSLCLPVATTSLETPRLRRISFRRMNARASNWSPLSLVTRVKPINTITRKTRSDSRVKILLRRALRGARGREEFTKFLNC